MRRNYVAKHMNQFNRASVVPNKRDKMLDDLWERENDELLDVYAWTANDHGSDDSGLLLGGESPKDSV